MKQIIFTNKCPFFNNFLYASIQYWAMDPWTQEKKNGKDTNAKNNYWIYESFNSFPFGVKTNDFNCTGTGTGKDIRIFIVIWRNNFRTQNLWHRRKSEL